MELKNKNIGVAVTGSFCTFEKLFQQLMLLVKEGANVQTICSNAVQTVDSRFGIHQSFLTRMENITGHPPILTIETAEPVGPKKLFDLLIILPCTGNTIAKLANGITDSPVLMAAKAHLRNELPLLLSISTNDALSMNLKNIGLLMNTKHIYFVPFGQDNPAGKTNSMIAYSDLTVSAAKAAMEQRQYQPVLISPFGGYVPPQAP